MAEETRIVSLSELNDKVDNLIKSLSSKQETPGPAVNAGSVDEQVTKAVEAAKARDAEDAEKKALHDRVAKLEGLSEKPPVEYKKLTKMMWGNE